MNRDMRHPVALGPGEQPPELAANPEQQRHPRGRQRELGFREVVARGRSDLETGRACPRNPVGLGTIVRHSLAPRQVCGWRCGIMPTSYTSIERVKEFVKRC